MRNGIILCELIECHGNENGCCRVLAEPITDKPCPFYKSKLRLALEREALKKDDWALYRQAAQIK